MLADTIESGREARGRKESEGVATRAKTRDRRARFISASASGEELKRHVSGTLLPDVVFVA